MIERFRYYVLVDHTARWRNDSICMAASIAWFLISMAAGVESARAFKVSIGFLIVPVVVSTLWYCLKPHDFRSPLEIDLPKRSLLAGLGASVVLMALVGIGTPALEAAIIDRRLRKLLDGEPTQDKIEEAAQIVSEANNKNLRASPQLISHLGQKLLNSSSNPHLRDSALTAASAFASYRSKLSPLPKTRAAESEIVGAILFQCGSEVTGGEPPILIGVPWLDKGPSGFQCSRAFVQPLPPFNTQAQLPLDGMFARNITFVDGTFFYDGGPLKLESVLFIDSRIQVPVTNAGNQNVRRLIGAILTGQPITLDLYTSAPETPPRAPFPEKSPS